MEIGRGNNPAADWVAAHVDDLLGHLRARLPRREDAQDIAQEACLKLLQTGRKANDIRNPKAYLYRIAHHLVHHHYAGVSKRGEVADVHVDAIPSDEDSVEYLTIDSLRRQQINHAMRELPPKCQQALLLRWQEGLRVNEIAAQMDLSRSMVKKYLARGLAHFRRRLGRFVLADRVQDQTQRLSSDEGIS